ncbi:MAG: 3-deoxy-8-phosphooctulonate synthase [Candidatus Methylomirabilales bacterium]
MDLAHRLPTRPVRVGAVTIGGQGPIVLIAGPCVIESESHLTEVAGRIREICDRLAIPFILKSSYDKANRSSRKSFRGPGLVRGLEILGRVKEALGLPILTDVHEPAQVAPVAAVVDALQIPAFLCRQTDLLIAAGQSGRAVNVKKGQFLAPEDLRNAVEKVTSTGNREIFLTERGTTFGYHNLVVDMRALPLMQTLGYPVIFDGSHSLQLPGGQGESSGGMRAFIPHLTRAAVAAGCDGIFLEVHPDPDQAPCDGPNMVPLACLPEFLSQIQEIHQALKRWRHEAAREKVTGG